MIENNEANLDLKEKEDKKIEDNQVIYKRSFPSNMNSYSSRLVKKQNLIKQKHEIDWNQLESVHGTSMFSINEEESGLKKFIDDRENNSDDENINKLLSYSAKTPNESTLKHINDNTYLNKSHDQKIIQRTKAFEQSIEKRKSELLDLNKKQMIKAKDKIKKY